MILMKKNVSLKKLTTMKIGGPAEYFVAVKNETDLIEAIDWAKNKPRSVGELKWRVIGEGSNIIPSDSGFKGLIIKNEIQNFEIHGEEIVVGSGYNLLKFIHTLNKNGLSGMEKMAGIPGTIGGALYGSAGAYGHEIKDHLISVKVFDGKKVRRLTKKQCTFSYRESIFKEKTDWIIIEATFKLIKADSKELARISKNIIQLREKKYPPNIHCPGSFFKNIVVEHIQPKSLREKFLTRIPMEKINHGKVAAGYLLDEAGAKSMKIEKIHVAPYHGNLIYNTGNGKTKDLQKLVKVLKGKVKKKFGIQLEEEVQYI